MNGKPWYLSRTLWFNFIGGIVEVLSLSEFKSVVPVSWSPYIALAIVVGNLILRKLTTQPLTA